MAATAYAVATAGIIFDHEEGRVFTPQQGRELVIKLLAERPRVKAFMADVARKLSTKP